jgi:hypothetical protein
MAPKLAAGTPAGSGETVFSTSWPDFSVTVAPQPLLTSRPFVLTPFVRTPFVRTPFVRMPFVRMPFVQTPFVRIFNEMPPFELPSSIFRFLSE